MRVPLTAPLLSLVVSLSLAAPLAAQAKPRVAVLQFTNATTNRLFGDQLGDAASDELTTQLVKAGSFTVIERRQVADILAEQQLGGSGAIAPGQAAEIGRLLGVQYVLLGSITQFSIDRKSGGLGPLSASFAQAKSAIDVRVVNTTTSEIVTVAEGSGEKRLGGVAVDDVRLSREFDAGVATEALRPAVENAVKQLEQRSAELAADAPAAPLAAVVGSRDGDIYIDRGENAGITVAQRFDVLRVVDTIRDANGNVLDEVVETVGVIEVRRVLSQSAICAVVEGEAKEGDRVRPRG